MGTSLVRRLMAALGVTATMGAMVACGPSRGPLDCTVLMSRPGTLGLPLDLGSWTPMMVNGWPLTEWWAKCQGRFEVIKVDERGPKPNPPNGIPVPAYLNMEGCVFHVDGSLALRAIWDLATLDPNYAWTN